MTDPNHIAEARKKVGRPQIREVFLRNGAVIPADRDDLPDYVYESVFELLDSVIQQAAPAIQYVGRGEQGEPLLRFNARVVESDPTGYYMTRWDRAQSVSVIAHTRDEAFEKVRTMMGDPTRHSAWAVRIDSAEEIVNDNQ